MPRTFSARSAAKRLLTRRPLAVESLEARDVPATYTWLPTGPGAFNWNDAANWSGGPAGTFPNAASDVAVLTGTLTGNELINLNVGITVGELDLGSAGVTGYTIAANGSAGTLTFADGDGTANLTASGTGGGDAVLAPIVLNTNTVLANTGSAPLTLGSTVGGIATLTTSGSVLALDRFSVLSTVTLAGTGTIAAAPVIYSPSFYDGGLYAFDAETGATLATLVAPNDAAQLALPAGVTTGPDGNLYFSDQGFTGPDNAIVRYNLRTFAVEPFVSSATLQGLVDPMNTGNFVFAPAGLKFGPDNNLYVAESGGFSPPAAGTPDAVYRFAASASGPGGDLVSGAGTQIATGIYNPTGLVFGTAAGDTTSLYVTSALGFTGNVFKITNATGATPSSVAVVTSANNAGLQFAAGIAIGPDGKLYVADLAATTGTSQVLSYNTDGSGGAVFIPSGATGTPGNLNGQFSTDLAFDAQGRLLLDNLGPNGPTQPGANANDYAGSIYRYSAAGAFDVALVTAAQFPDTQDTPAAGDDEATGVIPSGLTQAGPITVTAPRVSPGSGGPGILTVPDFNLLAGSFSVDVAGAAAGSGYDQLASTGTVNLGNATLNLNITFQAAVGDTFTLVSAAGVTGTFAGLPEGTTIAAGTQRFGISYTPTAVTLTRLAATAPTITGPTAATFYTGAAADFTVTADGSPAPTFTATGLPPGLAISAAGAITGTPTTPGTFTTNVTATNAFGSDTEPFTFTVNTGVPPQITSANAVTVPSTGGTFAVTATGTPTPTLAQTGTLPTGVTFDPATGTLTVAPGTAGGSYPLTFAATNGVTPPASQAFTLTVTAAPAITSSNAATFTVGTAASFTVTASGFPAPAITQAGTLPAGVTFDAGTSSLTGTPTEAGSFPITFTAVSSSGTTTQNFTLTVAPAGVAPQITSANAATFVVGTGGTFAVTATGTPTPTLAQTGTLPTGVSFDAATGTLTVAPTAAAGTYNLNFTATNATGTATQPFTLTVTAAGVAPAFTSPNAVSFVAGQGAGFTVTATGSPTFSQTGTLPAGVTFAPATAVLGGTPTQTGSFPITFTATNASGTTTQAFTLTVTAAGPAPQFTSPATASFLAGQPVNFQVTAAGSPTPTFSAFGLPNGILLSLTGLLSGTAAAGSYPVIIMATNASGSATQNFTLTLTAAGTAPQFVSANATTFAVGTAGTFQVTATGSPTPTLTLSGTLPGGVTFDPATGSLRGAPTAAGTFPLTLTATNPSGTATQAFTLTATAAGTPPRLPSRLTVSGPTSGGVAIYDPSAAGTYPNTATAFLNPFQEEVRTAVADVNGDGVPDTIVVGGPNSATQFAVFSGIDGTVLVTPTQVFEGSFTGGAFVSAADLDGDGRAEIVITPDQGGGPRVTIFGLPVGTSTPVVKANFFGIDDPTFRGGARAAIGDVNHDGTADLAVAAGFLGGPRVAVFDGKTLFATPTKLVGDFFAFPGLDAVNLRNGVYVAAGDVDGDGFADLIFGGGPGGGPRVFVLSGARIAAGDVSGAQANPIANFFVAGNANDRYGVRVAATDADADGKADIVVGSGSGLPARVRIYLGKNVTTSAEPTAVQDLTVFDGTALTDGVYVG